MGVTHVDVDDVKVAVSLKGIEHGERFELAHEASRGSWRSRAMNRSSDV